MLTVCQMVPLFLFSDGTFNERILYHITLSSLLFYSYTIVPIQTGEETESKRLNKLPKVTKVENGGTKTAAEAFRPQSPSSSPHSIRPFSL